MLTDENLQTAFRLARYLHPENVAICVVQDALADDIPTLNRTQAKRPGTDKPVKLILSERNLLQQGVYQASEKWEKDQESANPKETPLYRPTVDDMVVRYVKNLALKSLILPPRNAAVAVGCHLHTYQPHDISALSEEFFSSENIRRDKDRMDARIKKRFSHLFADPAAQVVLGAPTERERALIRKALSAFALWWPCPTLSEHEPQATFLETCFSEGAAGTNHARVHALFDTACCGLAKLVREYNSFCLKGSNNVLDDPENKLGAPRFPGFDGHKDGGGGDGGPDDWGARFNPDPLTEAALSSIRHAVEKRIQRRNQYRGSELHVYVDDVEKGAFTHDYLFETLNVTHAASCIKVFGEDEDEEEILLAVFPLYFLDPDDEGLGQSLSVALEGGQSIELSVAPVRERGRETSESVVRLKYTESPAEASQPRAAVAEAARPSEPAVEEDSRDPHNAFWESVFEQVYPRLKSYALAVVGGKAYDAEDLVQETCYRALRYAKGPEEVENPFGYLWKVMRNVWVDKGIRQHAARVESLEEMLDRGQQPPVEPQVLRLLENSELQGRLRAGQGPLTQREKLLLDLHLGGYKCKDIADRLNEDTRLTRTDLNALRAKLRYRLGAARRDKGWGRLEDSRPAESS